MSNASICKTAFAVLLLTSFAAQAGQLRSFNPIAAPERTETKGVYQPGPDAQRVAEPQPVARQSIEEGVSDLLENWNQGDPENLLDEQFYDRTRLTDSIEERVPRDAKLRLLGVAGSQVLEQYRYEDEGAQVLSSVVSVTANTQMEFNDPAMGFRRLNGQNEYILRIDEVIEERAP